MTETATLKGFDEDVLAGVLVVRESNQVFDFNMIPGFTETTGLTRRAAFHGYKQKISDCTAGMNKNTYTNDERDAKRQAQFDCFVSNHWNMKRATGGKSLRNDLTLAKKMGVTFEIAYKTLKPSVGEDICLSIWDSIEI